jgi:hypothetical protein
MLSLCLLFLLFRPHQEKGSLSTTLFFPISIFCDSSKVLLIHVYLVIIQCVTYSLFCVCDVNHLFEDVQNIIVECTRGLSFSLIHVVTYEKMCRMLLLSAHVYYHLCFVLSISGMCGTLSFLLPHVFSIHTFILNYPVYSEAPFKWNVLSCSQNEIQKPLSN